MGYMQYRRAICDECDPPGSGKCSQCGGAGGILSGCASCVAGRANVPPATAPAVARAFCEQAASWSTGGAAHFPHTSHARALCKSPAPAYPESCPKLPTRLRRPRLAKTSSARSSNGSSSPPRFSGRSPRSPSSPLSGSTRRPPPSRRNAASNRGFAPRRTASATTSSRSTRSRPISSTR